MALNREGTHSCIRDGEQAGFAAITVLTVLVVGSLFALTSQLNTAAALAPVAREARVVETLNRAKSALISFAAENVNRPGGLPCPDRDGDGEAELTCDRPEQRVGFLPWQTLKTGDLRDSSGGRLWYAVSKGFRNDPDAIINSNTPGELSIQRREATGSVVSETKGVVALVIAPGAALAGQTRTAAGPAQVDAWLEGENASGDARVFEAGTRTAQFNDVVVSLGQGELFDVVDRIVASRIRREIAPLLRERVFETWRALPFAVPFEAPSRSDFLDQAKRDLPEGLLPASHDADWVTWRTNGIDARQEGGEGRVSAIACAPSIPREVRCDIDYAGSVRVRIAAPLQNVGRALIGPMQAEDGSFGPDNLVGRRISIGGVDATGDALIVASATLPAMSTRVRVYLRAPAPIAELTNPRIPVASAYSWFARNRWHELLYYAVSPAAAPGNPEQPCDPSSARSRCLRLDSMQSPATQAAALLVFMGRSREGLPRANPDALSAYLEGDNALPGDGSFADGTASPTFNDAVIVVCANPARGCQS
jgi:hypothetical protein